MICCLSFYKNWYSKYANNECSILFYSEIHGKFTSLFYVLDGFEIFHFDTLSVYLTKVPIRWQFSSHTSDK